MTNTAHLWGKPGSESWYSTPTADLAAALNYYGPAGVSIDSVKRIHHGYASYHGDEWTGGDEGIDTELDLAVVAELWDGRWIAVVASNDYTGWGCRDSADVYVGPTREDVIANGLDQGYRVILGFEELTLPEGIER
ncbi:MAG: hypothetical protein KIT69_14225 [Propionibacteriaceae bacterium]|nr:hypothetical protein [Propionibacteriaceae bacterium]